MEHALSRSHFVPIGIRMASTLRSRTATKRTVIRRPQTESFPRRRRSSRRDGTRSISITFRSDRNPDGFGVAITNGNKANRHKTPANGKLPAPAPFEPTGWNTLYLDHISFEVPDYRRSAAFYQALLGWDVRSEERRVGEEG